MEGFLQQTTSSLLAESWMVRFNIDVGFCSHGLLFTVFFSSDIIINQIWNLFNCGSLCIYSTALNMVFLSCVASLIASLFR